MAMFKLVAILFAVAQSSVAVRNRNFNASPGIPIVTDYPEPAVDAPPLNTTYFFDQLIDHNDTSKGTFKQRYWHNAQYYQEGGPIILMTPGEANAQPYTGYLTNVTINGKIAEQHNGTTIVLEHRFYGESNPYPNLEVSSLEYHTIEQAVEDLDYFARNVVLPQENGDNLGPDYAPWVNVGGSYSGALVSWVRYRKPDLFWAGYASSAVVEAIFDFWEYFEPIRIYMPQNCSADVEAVISRVDEVFTGDNETAIRELKDNWGLGNLSHLDDVAGALRNNLWDWQSLQPTTGYATFFQFCDALEVKDGESADENGWGVEHALAAWGDFWTEGGYYANLCGNRSAEDCFGTHDPNSTFYTDTEVDNTWRSWNWIVCNEVGYLQDAAPEGHPSLVSRLVQPEYDLISCNYMYPEKFGNDTVYPDIDGTNERYGNWSVKQDRTFFANGLRDPWRYATTSAPDSPAQNTSMQPIGLSDGFHCSDLSITRGAADKTVADVQTAALAKFTEWLPEWTPPSSSAHKKEKKASWSVNLGVSESSSAPVISPRDLPDSHRETAKPDGPKAVGNVLFRGATTF